MLPRRQLGRTGLSLSSLGLGGAAFGNLYGTLAEGEAERIVRTALEGGINYLDVAPYYGVTRAETVLGQALRGIPRDRYCLSTKVGRYDVDRFDFSPQRVLASVDESLQRLRIDHIDLILCHDIEFVPIEPVIEETLPALRKARDAGKVRFIGFSGLPLAIYRRVLARTDVDAIISYCHCTLFDTSLLKLLPLFQSRGVGVINASPLSMGLLSDQGPQPWHPASAEIQAACRRAVEHCRRRGASLAKLALQFAASHQEVDVTLSGAATAEEVARSIAWLQEPIDQELLREVRALLQSIQDQTWPSGLAENN
jgi:L-galactose dehydrogenase